MKQLCMLLASILMCLQGCSIPANNTNIKIDSMTDKNIDWKKKLTPPQYYVLREKGTEPAFSGALLLQKDKGIYKCAGCGNELFTSEMKFESHCGWPSFDKEIAGGKIKQTPDSSHGRQRIEITCAACEGHLGHIFNDGPTETGKRYCVNSLALQFEPANNHSTLDSIIIGGGCFWCTEAIFAQMKGVAQVESGYSGGHKINPTYEDICTGLTNHAEVVKIRYNKNIISTQQILAIFFAAHNPTTLNQQGADVGTQYRSVIYYSNNEQKAIANNMIEKIDKEKIFTNKIVTTVLPAEPFYKAEDYHQNYYANNTNKGYCQLVIAPKLEKIKKLFEGFVK